MPVDLSIENMQGMVLRFVLHSKNMKSDEVSIPFFRATDYQQHARARKSK